MSAPASESLDPCPWCDTTTHLLFVEASTDESYEKGRILARVVCNNPTHNGLIAGPAAFTSQPYVSWGTPVSEAIAAWNARAILSRLTASEARNGELSGELEKIAEMCGEADDPFSAWETIELWRDNLQASEARVKQLEGVLNTPDLHDFSEGVVREAAHQRERWGVDHDAGKEPEDWFWLVGYLTGKALAAAKAGDTDKALHHTISTAATLANWHAALSGVSTTMQPGHAPSAVLADALLSHIIRDAAS